MSAKRSKPAAPGGEAAASRALKPSDAPAVMGSDLLAEVRELILTTRQSVARGVNAALTMLYWQIGTRVRGDILADQRAEYGKQVVAAVGQQLESEFGRGFGEKNLRRMVQFAEVFPDHHRIIPLEKVERIYAARW